MKASNTICKKDFLFTLKHPGIGLKFLLIPLFILFTSIVYCAVVEKDPYVDSVLRIYNSKIQDTVKLEILQNLTKYLLNNNPGLVPQYCSIGAELARKVKKPDVEAAFETNMGTKYYFEGNYEMAILYFIKAFKINESAKNDLGMANALNNIGIMYYLWKNYTKAIEHLDKAAYIYKKLGKEEQIYRNRSNAGLIYIDTEQWDKALENFNKTMKFYEDKKNEPELAKAYNNTATAYLGLGKYSEAEKYLLKSLELNKKLNNKNATSVNLYNLARAYKMLGQYSKAIQYLDESRKYPEENKQYRSLILIMKHYSEVYEKTGDYQNALEYYKKYETIKDTIFNSEKIKQITEIQTKYETEKTNKENEDLITQAREQKILYRTMLAAIIFFSLTAILAILLLLFKIRSTKRLKENHKVLQNLNSELEKAKSEAERANNLKSSFLANISHEIRTPLNAIIGFTRVLGNRLTDPNDRQFLGPIESGSKSLLALLNDILDMSKIEANKVTITLESVNLHQTVNEVVEIFHPSIVEKGIKYELKWDQKIPEFIKADEIRIRQILFNLIGNALKFTEHGRITITTSLRHSYDSIEQIKFKPFEIAISIEDTGIGIDPKEQSSLFQPFRQLASANSKKMGGTGLGLAISKRLAEILNGEIILSSEPGKGSTFTLILRKVMISNEIVNAPQEKTSQFQMPNFSQALILTIDDEEYNRNLITYYLENTKLRVIEANNGKVGLEKAKQYNPNLILVDLRMPLLDGEQFLREIRADAQLQNTPVICVTASIADNDEKKTLQLSFDGVLMKPLFPEDLAKVLTQFLKVN